MRARNIRFVRCNAFFGNFRSVMNVADGTRRELKKAAKREGVVVDVMQQDSNRNGARLLFGVRSAQGLSSRVEVAKDMPLSLLRDVTAQFQQRGSSGATVQGVMYDGRKDRDVPATNRYDSVYAMHLSNAVVRA
ncbi:hypothetical protein ACFL5U_02700 [Candidatus Margulisiibacteriota bacterium]